MAEFRKSKSLPASPGLPRVKKKVGTERAGIAALMRYASDQGQIWRETPATDMGIDGQLEFVNANEEATGRLVAVQSKSGESYFSRPAADGWWITPLPKHRRYWEQFPLPVLIVLHDPRIQRSFWVDVRQALRHPRMDLDSIFVPSKQVLENTPPLTLFQTAGAQDLPFAPMIEEVLTQLAAHRCANACFSVSYLELFALGLTNLARSIYVGMDLADTIAACALPEDSLTGVGIGPQEHDFLFGFTRFLIAQDLARVDFADCLIDWEDQQMQPHYVAPLTQRGRALVRWIHSEEQRLVTAGALPDAGYVHVAQEAFFEMQVTSYATRLDRVREFSTKWTPAGRPKKTSSKAKAGGRK